MSHPDTAKLVEAGKEYVLGWISYWHGSIKGYEEYHKEQEPTRWLAMFGGYGNGKSHVAAAIVKSFVQYEFEAEYYYVPDLLDDLRRGQFENAEDEYGNIKGKRFDAVMDRLKAVEVLVLDDLGSDKATDWADAQLDKVIDYRYRQNKQLVVVSNVGLKDLPARVADRLSDNEICTRVVTKAPSYRPKNKR